MAASASATPTCWGQKDEVRQTLGCLPQGFGVYPKVSAERLLERFAPALRRLQGELTTGRANVAPPLLYVRK